MKAVENKTKHRQNMFQDTFRINGILKNNINNVNQC